MNKEFKLKENTILQAPGFGVYTNANLTDEIALAVLAKNRRIIVLFAEAPTDWKAQVDKFIAAKAAPAVPEKAKGKKGDTKKNDVYLVTEKFEILENTEENANANKVINVGSKDFCEAFVSANKPADDADKKARKEKFKADVSGDSKKELRELADSNEFPKKDWDKLNVEEITEYLAEKLYSTVEL